MKRLILAILVAASMAAAAGIDGKWTSEVRAQAAKKATQLGAQPKTAQLNLDLKSSGGQITGSVTAANTKKGRGVELQNGKLEGDSFSFTTVHKSKKGEVKWTWRGTVKGNELTGTRTREGGRRGQAFTAKRVS